jgi:hypothetical protein
MCPACDGPGGPAYDFGPGPARARPGPSRLGGGRSSRSADQGDRKWRRHPLRGLAPTREAVPDGPPRFNAQGALEGPSSPLAERLLYRQTGDRVIVHRWKNRSKTVRTPVPGRGSPPELLANVPAAQRGRPRPARAVHAEPDLPRLQRRAGSTPAPAPSASAASRSSSSAACRSAASRGSSTPWPTRPPATRGGRGPRPARPALDDDRRRAAEGDPRPTPVPDDVGLHYLAPRPRRPDALRRRGPAHPAREPGGGGLVGVLYILDEPRSACIRATMTS